MVRSSDDPTRLAGLILATRAVNTRPEVNELVCPEALSSGANSRVGEHAQGQRAYRHRVVEGLERPVTRPPGLPRGFAGEVEPS